MRIEKNKKPKIRVENVYQTIEHDGSRGPKTVDGNLRSADVNKKCKNDYQSIFVHWVCEIVTFSFCFFSSSRTTIDGPRRRTRNRFFFLSFSFFRIQRARALVTGNAIGHRGTRCYIACARYSRTDYLDAPIPAYALIIRNVRRTAQTRGRHHSRFVPLRSRNPVVGRYCRSSAGFPWRADDYRCPIRVSSSVLPDGRRTCFSYFVLARNAFSFVLLRSRSPDYDGYDSLIK